MVKVICVNQVLSDADIKQKEGEWITEDCIKHLIEEDTDAYGIDSKGEKFLLCKFRKNVIDAELCQIGFDNFKNAAKPSRSRGAAAGFIDTEGVYWKKRELTNTNKWRTGYLNDGKQSKMSVNNPVVSGALGYYEKSPNFGLPCRMTHHTKTSLKKFEVGLPFIERIDELFKELVEDRYAMQYDRASLRPDFQINDTAFSTLTINRNFRTALHRDAGDYSEGFGNLSVLEYGKYSGGYTTFPQYGIGINLRQGDFVAMNVHQYHANTPIYETTEDKAYNDTLESIYKRDNPDIGTAGICKKYNRLSFVCYLREKIIHCENVKKQTEI